MPRASEFPWIENCGACKIAGSAVFCGLEGARLERFESATLTNMVPKGALIYLEDNTPRGIHILCSGKVKLSTSNEEGKRTILGLAEQGDILGARAILVGSPYDHTAEALEATQVRFLPKGEFTRFLAENGDICLRLACELSGELCQAYDNMRRLAFRDASEERMIHLLLKLVDSHGHASSGGVSIGIELNREELGEMIGATRETASRILASLERKKILKSEGKRIVVLNADSLRKLISA